jgi:hypothetical protein
MLKLLLFTSLLLTCSPRKLPVPVESEPSTGEALETSTQLFELMQNSPNPFKESTLIRFRVEQTSVVQLRVDLKSQGFVDLVNEVKDGPETYYVVFTAPASLPNGVYRCTMTVNGRYQLKGMTLQR